VGCSVGTLIGCGVGRSVGCDVERSVGVAFPDPVVGAGIRENGRMNE
jgi:hypothetical protein